MGLSFILFFLKWSAGKGFWYRLRVTDNITYKKAITVKALKKFEICKLHISFWNKCRYGNVFPTFAKVKKFKDTEKKHRNRYYRRLLLDEISNKHKRLKQLNKQLDDDLYLVNNNANWMKSKCIVYSINILNDAYIKKTQVTHNMKLDKLFKKKQEKDGLKETPNNVICNLTSEILSNEECRILRYYLNHGIVTKLKESDILASDESVWDQISKDNICKESHYNVERAKNSLKPLAFNLIDFDNNQVYKDKTKLEIIKNLWQELATLKPNKEKSMLLVRTIDYLNAVPSLFSDPSKFKQI